MDRRPRGRTRLLQGPHLQLEGLGTGKRLEGLAAETEHRLVGSVGWMLDPFVTGSWIPSLLIDSRRYR